MKPIKLTEEMRTKALQNFQNLLNDYNGSSDLNIRITSKTLLEDACENPIVYLTASTYLKIMSVVSTSNKELAWHGVVTKLDNNYLISDIMLYPQTVTTTTVDADEEKYAQWLMQLDDNTIKTLRFQGHSHVNMGASPSGRDTDNWQKFLNILKDDDFYIFCIANKKGDFYWNIYDKSKNILFENQDITMKVIDTAAQCIKDWADEEIKNNIVEQTYTTRAFQTTLIPDHSIPIQTTSNTYKQQYFEEKNPSDVVLSYNTDQVPATLAAIGVGYCEEVDMYHCDTQVSGFWYSTTWGCFIMDGNTFRKKYGTTPAKNTKRGRPPKTNKKK